MSNPCTKASFQEIAIDAEIFGHLDLVRAQVGLQGLNKGWVEPAPTTEDDLRVKQGVVHD